jgi:predicted nucleotide-binding protein
MAGKKGAISKNNVPPRADGKRVYFKQSDFPQVILQEAQKIATALINDFGGKEGSPPDVALAAKISPTSSTWPTITGSSIAYGLSEGGVNAAVIKLTELGKRLVAPESEGEDLAARREAILKPRICREFFEKYKRAKFPSDQIAENVLRSLGIPAERLKTAVGLLRENGKYSGIIRNTPTGLFVNLDSPGVPGPAVSTRAASQDSISVPIEEVDDGALAAHAASVATRDDNAAAIPNSANNRVFISHGKQKAIVAQLKELLTFGNFEPFVSVERESTAVPVPEKVFEDMRACGAGVIHVGPEGKYLDADGTEHTKINDNVLIEIGAAIALYGKKVILLVERGVTLPSNLQGLYRCEFAGDKLDYEATMKLLKTFSQFR